MNVIIGPKTSLAAKKVLSELFPDAQLSETPDKNSYNIYSSPKLLKTINLSSAVKMAGHPVPGGFCLPDIDEVLKNKYINKLFTSVQRIKYHIIRKRVPVTVITQKSDIIQFLQNVSGKLIAIDYETKYLSPLIKGAKILTMAITHKTTNGDLVNTAFPIDYGQFSYSTDTDVREALSNLFTDPGTLVICHNAKYEIKWTLQYLEMSFNLYFDTMIGTHLLDENKSNALENLTWEYFPEIAGYEEFTAGVEDYEDITLTNLCVYNGIDTHVTYKLSEKLIPALLNDGLIPYWKEVSRPATYTLAKMELNGFEVNWKEYNRLMQWYENQLTFLYQQLENQPAIVQLTKELAAKKKKFTLRSYDQKQRLLFGISKIKPNLRLKTKSGNLSTDAEAIEWYANENPNIDWLNTVKLINKVGGIISTFLKDRPKMADAYVDNRIHTNYNTTMVVTGRLSSSNPNQQNLPRSSDLKNIGFEPIKRMYCSRFDDGVLLSADYSQVEMRVVTSIANDEPFIKAYNTGEDVHANTAKILYGPNWTSEQRTKAKRVNFSILNDITARELAIDTHEDEDTAQQYITTFFKAHPAIRAFMNKYHRDVMLHNYVVSVLGRRRRFTKELAKKDLQEWQVAHIQRQSANFPIQSAASDITLRTMSLLDDVITMEKLHSVLIGNVHDSIIVDCPAEEVDTVARRLQTIVDNIVELTQWHWIKVPMEIDITIGKNLDEQEPYTT